MTKELLIVFVKNPRIGRVKTRLAETLGDHAALSIYRKLVTHTHTITRSLPQEKVVFFSDFIEPGLFDQNFLMEVQRGSDLGERMEKAFNWGFEQGYARICIIGSDCLELDSATILQGFESLKRNQVVIGPSEDGGYYLLGMRELHQDLFRDKSWSTEKVYSQTVDTINSLQLTHENLPVLKDIDHEGDLPEAWRITQN